MQQDQFIYLFQSEARSNALCNIPSSRSLYQRITLVFLIKRKELSWWHLFSIYPRMPFPAVNLGLMMCSKASSTKITTIIEVEETSLGS